LDALNLFLGRYYIRRIARVHPPIRSAFSKVGDIFWFDQYRNLGTAMSWKSSVGDQSLETTGEEEREAEAESWSVGVERLREYLVGWWAYHTSGEKAEGSDYIQTLEQNMERLFPGTSFRGVVPRGTRSLSPMKDFYFLLARNNRVFDIAEMSSGEQSIFSLLYEFVRLNITKSIVLIDELELHLHPPEQQALRAALPALASDCQYLVTTHSSYLADTMSTAQLSRLEGGRRCL